MYYAKVFDEQHEEDLMNVLNDFFNENPNVHIMHIQFSNSCAVYEDTQIYCFSVLLIYRL